MMNYLGRSVWYLTIVCLVQSIKDESKRLVLHSDTDLTREVLSLRAELANATSRISKLELQKSDGPGSIYVRWGKTTCLGDAEIIYHGYFAGKHFNEKGSGTNSLCLPTDPIWGYYEDGHQDFRGAIYGTETDIPSQFFSFDVVEQDMPCAVCQSKRATTLMIPARKQCYPGWTMEYWGYLAGASSDHYFSYDNVCLDSHPDILDHGGANDNQHIMHIVEGRCGSLPCPPYVDGRELTCVVCSK